MRTVLLLFLLVLLPSTHAMAETWVATGPGMMCSSPNALARLTLPDGSSRAGLPSAGPAYARVAAQGGCIDIPLGAHVSVRTARKNTSIVGYDANDGRGMQTFIIPNIDFSADPIMLGDKDDPGFSLGSRPFWSAVFSQCPQQGWSGRALSRVEVGSPIESFGQTLTPIQNEALQHEEETECVAGLACPTDVYIGFMIRVGHLREMVRATCAMKAPKLDD